MGERQTEARDEDVLQVEDRRRSSLPGRRGGGAVQTDTVSYGKAVGERFCHSGGCGMKAENNLEVSWHEAVVYIVKRVGAAGQVRVIELTMWVGIKGALNKLIR